MRSALPLDTIRRPSDAERVAVEHLGLGEEDRTLKARVAAELLRAARERKRKRNDDSVELVADNWLA